MARRLGRSTFFPFSSANFQPKGLPPLWREGTGISALWSVGGGETLLVRSAWALRCSSIVIPVVLPPEYTDPPPQKPSQLVIDVGSPQKRPPFLTWLLKFFWERIRRLSPLTILLLCLVVSTLSYRDADVPPVAVRSSARVTETEQYQPRCVVAISKADGTTVAGVAWGGAGHIVAKHSELIGGTEMWVVEEGSKKRIQLELHAADVSKDIAILKPISEPHTWPPTPQPTSLNQMFEESERDLQRASIAEILKGMTPTDVEDLIQYGMRLSLSSNPGTSEKI